MRTKIKPKAIRYPRWQKTVDIPERNSAGEEQPKRFCRLMIDVGDCPGGKLGEVRSLLRSGPL
jgi:hypothetical protein